jgi:hypothetical protein
MNRSRGPAAPARRQAAGALLLAPLAGLGACAPAHDWREVRSDDVGCWVMLPGRPAQMARTIHLEDLKLEMTMIGAQARDVSYTVGAVTLPESGEAALPRALAAMRTAMVRNIGGTERAARTVRVARIDGGGQPLGSVAGVEVRADGRMRERGVTLLARFVGVGRHAWQAVVLGTRPDPEAATLFLDSLKLRR